MSEELKSCPFCGGKASFGKIEYSSDQEPFAWFADGTPVLIAHFINCQICGANNQSFVGGYQTKEQAITAWNTRAGEKA